MNIGEVSSQLSIPASTIRYYEKIGLIERQGRISGRRQFNERAIYTLQFVQLARIAGFSIAEIKSLLKNYEKDYTASGLWNPLAKAKQKSIREQINNLQYMDSILDKLIQCRCKTLKACIQATTKCARINVEQKTQHASK
ncbi:MAG: Cu(I)-responsive transcriptional regulator [SAR86 cluster bacterium]|uniref:Cu(I)-responsive transcriptional regulator n=1 Tax=SAR86 cluster bacterium TaxID=2030880 RepID=A0A2A5B8P5_9GAMM|nr:MAG: Cu(I)-responsive transcriptional regulator [SAR86 cluster bacterium]